MFIEPPDSVICATEWLSVKRREQKGRIPLAVILLMLVSSPYYLEPYFYKIVLDADHNEWAYIEYKNKVYGLVNRGVRRIGFAEYRKDFGLTYKENQ